MKIRAMQAADLQTLARLYRQFWGEASDLHAMEQKFRALRDNEAYILLCAEEDGQVIGSVMGVVCEELYGDCKPFLVLENMIVDQTLRQKGVGRRLFEELEHRALEKNCVQMILVTEQERADACAFYESLGFHPTHNKGYKKKLG